jgi:hypothetical protein
MQIDVKNIPNLLITSIICDYDVEFKNSPQNREIPKIKKTSLYNPLYMAFNITSEIIKAKNHMKDYATPNFLSPKLI